MSVRDWVDLTDREVEAFGSAAAGLVWRPKDRNVGLRDPDGRLMAVAGATLADVEVDGAGTFAVVGLGGLIVRREGRGRGLGVTLMDGLVRMARGLGPELAMIFCRDELGPLYVRRGYTEITEAVWVDQPGGRIQMPLVAMWRPVHGRPVWPAGRVDVRGLPF